MSNSETHKRRGRLPKIEVVDLFCGIGGLSYGMKSKGFKILTGFDLDWTCQYAYETNNEARFVYKDIRDVQKEDIVPLYSKKAIKVLAGCAPCQPFSSYAFKNKNKDENKYNLLYEFGRLVKEVHPDIVTMENVPAIAGLGVAVQKTFDNFDEKISHIRAVRDKLVKGLTAIDEVYTNTDIENGAPHIASMSFVGVRAEVMLHALEDKGIYVSSGSACSSNKSKESAVLSAIGLDKQRLESTLRFSCGEDNTEEEVDYAINTINELLPVLRHYVRG